MPFIKQDRRDKIEEMRNTILDLVPGDMCYFYYASFVREWKKDPRWTTAHIMYEDHWNKVRQHKYATDSDTVAADLAWQVFFQLYVMPYELQKRQENGDIE